MLELTCQDEEIEVVLAGSDLAVLRAVTDAIVINIPLTVASAAAIVELLSMFVQPSLN